MSKLSAGHRHLLKLAVKGKGADGWAPVSAAVMPIVKGMPSELVEVESVGSEGRGRIRLTQAGESIIFAMEWL